MNSLTKYLSYLGIRFSILKSLKIKILFLKFREIIAFNLYLFRTRQIVNRKSDS